MKLISMTDFVLEQNSKWSCEGALFNIVKYANFLKTPLKLEMFVPCDNNGNVLQEPYFDGENDMYFSSAYDEYQTALSKIWFKGFEYNPNGYVFKDFDKFDDEWFVNATIEDLIPYNLEITENFGKNL